MNKITIKKMKKLITLSIMLFGVATLQAQNLKSFKSENNLYGLKDQKGKIIVAPKYSQISEFSEGFAAVSILTDANEWGEIYSCGFIDETGKEVIPAKFKTVNKFSDGLAPVMLNRTYGYIDKMGKEIISYKYDYADVFIGGLALVAINEKYGFINKQGEEVIPLQYDIAEPFAEGLSIVKVIDKTAFPHIIKRGCIDKTGKIVVPLKEYDYILEFTNGKAKVKLNGREFYIDKTGKEIK